MQDTVIDLRNNPGLQGPLSCKLAAFPYLSVDPALIEQQTNCYGTWTGTYTNTQTVRVRTSGGRTGLVQDLQDPHHLCIRAAKIPSTNSFVTSKPVEQWNFNNVGVWLRVNSISKPTIGGRMFPFKNTGQTNAYWFHS